MRIYIRKYTNINDIFEELDIKKRLREEIVEPNIKVNKKYEIVYNVLENMPITVDEISKKTKLDISQTNHILTMLEIEGLIKCYPGNEYSLLEEGR